MRSILNLILIVYLGISGSIQARNPVLLPLPQKYVRTNASFHPKEIAISSEGKLCSILMEFLEELPVSIQPDSRYKIKVSLVDKLDGVPLNSEEAYQLSVSTRG
ncbi:MAG: beta-N-acetylhexosaminidase, partial [Parabacteroides sp.]|nr:beta-N-acetylhexosaminidase [Parabacteroides sp.]